MTSKLMIGAVAALSTFAAAQCGSSKSACESGSYKAANETITVGNAAPGDIIDVATKAGSFDTLAAALDAAGLVGALQGEGPFTVFAPTDDAFAKLPRGTVQTLLRPQNRGALTGILTFHVVSGELDASKVVRQDYVTTLNGQRANITVEDGKVMIAGRTVANVVATDVNATNGVIHVIDSVILPADKNIVETATEAGQFSTLLAAAKAAGLAEALVGPGPFTVFAPTDEAFQALPSGTVQSLLRPENRTQLANILRYHVVSGRVYADQAVGARRAPTLLGQEVAIRIRDGRLNVNNAKIIGTDIDASNGVIHVIDRVLLPQN